jgi:hypothetical protein
VGATVHILANRADDVHHVAVWKAVHAACAMVRRRTIGCERREKLEGSAHDDLNSFTAGIWPSAASARPQTPSGRLCPTSTAASSCGCCGSAARVFGVIGMQVGKCLRAHHGTRRQRTRRHMAHWIEPKNNARTPPDT